MRLGAYRCDITQGTNSSRAYKKQRIMERHRHRYEFNNEYRTMMEEQGLIFPGIHPKGELVEIIEG